MAAARTAIRPTTRLHYARDIGCVLIPHLAWLRLANPGRPPATGVSAETAQTTNSKGKPQFGRRPLVVYWR